MTESAASVVLAYSESAVVITLVVVFALIALGLWFSVWHYRKDLEYRRSLMHNRQVVKICPSCDTAMEIEVKSCPNCGREMPTETTITP